jgi:vitamin B12 transporter
MSFSRVSDTLPQKVSDTFHFLKSVWHLFLLLTLLLPLHAEEEDDDALLFMEDEAGITVTASPETTQPQKTITRDEIDKLHPQDVADLLEAALNMPLTRYGGYGNDVSVSMRGFDSERVAILIDGVPVNSRQSGDFNLGWLDVNAIDHIDVVYGGSDSKYNVTGALGGIINIVTRHEQAPGLRLSLTAANTASLPGAYYERDGEKAAARLLDLLDGQNLSLSAGYGAERYSLAASAFMNRAGNHFLYDDYYGVKRRKDKNEVFDSGASLSFTRGLPQWATLIATGSLYYGDKQIPTAGSSSVAGTQRDFSTRQNILLNAPRALRDDLAAEASLAHTWSCIGYERSGATPSDHDEHSVVAINRWNWYALPHLTLNAGWDYRYTRLDSTDSGLHEGNDGGLSLTAEFKALGGAFLVIPSVKFAFSGSTGGNADSGAEFVPVPKLGWVWQVSDTISLKNNFFRSFKFPDFDDLYWTGGGYTGNPDLHSEDGWGADFTASYETDTLHASATLFAQYTSDSIHWSSADGVWKPRNISEAAFFGIDSDLRVTLPRLASWLEPPTLSLSYQYLASFLLNDALTFASQRRIPYMPAHTIGASLEVPWASGSLLFAAHYESLRYAETSNIAKLAPYFLLNLTAQQALNETISAFMALRNLLNASYQSLLDYPMPGVTLTLGAQAKW